MQVVDQLDMSLQVLAMGKETSLLKLANVCPDGTRIEANASRHSALSHGHIDKLKAQRKAEVQALFSLADQADQADVPDGVSLPEESKRRDVGGQGEACCPDWREWHSEQVPLPARICLR